MCGNYLNFSELEFKPNLNVWARFSTSICVYSGVKVSNCNQKYKISIAANVTGKQIDQRFPDRKL